MGFLAPAAFFAGGGLLLAIVASYLLRPRRPVRRLSSTFLWLAALNELHAQQPWRRVPPSLLLLMQIAALAALVAALARPFALSADASGPFAIVLLDGSASMQATDVVPSRFEAARRRVGQMIDTLEPGQLLAIVSLDSHPRLAAPPSNDRAQLRRALDALHPTTRSANLVAALGVARSLAEGHPGAQVTIVGDGSLDRSAVSADFPMPLRYVAIGTQDADNLAVAGLQTRVVNSRLSVLARVSNFGTRAKTATLVLRVDGARFDSRVLPVEPGGSVDAQWDDLPSTAHTLEARLDQADSLSLDDAAWAVLDDDDRPTRILLVSDGNVFVERALSLRPAARVARVSPSDYSTARAAASDLIVLDGFVPPVLPSGGSVLLLHPPPDNPFVPAGPEIGVSDVVAARQTDALLVDVPLAGVHISRSRRLELPAWADVVLTSPETPLLLVGQQSGRRIAVLGFDVHHSDLPLQPGFPVLTQHLLDWLVPRGYTATPVVQVGASVALAPLPDAASIDVIAPDGARVQVGPPMPPAPFAATETPGLYQVVQRDANGRETTSLFAANFVDARESRLAPGFESGAPSVGPRGEPLKAPREVWEALAVLGLILLAIEAALAWWQFAAPTLRARLALTLRLAMAGLLVAALFGVAWPQRVERQAVIFVADVSASVREAQPQIADFIARAVSTKRVDDAYAVVSTARRAVVDKQLTTATLGQQPGLPTVEGTGTDGTDLAAGLRLAADLLPASYRSRVVLVSDGQETTGNAIAQARDLQAQGIRVDSLALPSATEPEVLVDRVSAPSVVQEGERFSVAVRLQSNVETDGFVQVFVNDRSLAEQAVSLRPGTTDLTFGAKAAEAGLLDVHAVLKAERDTLAQNNEAGAVVEVQGPPRVLVVEQRPGEGAAIASALSSSGMRLETRAPADLPDRLEVLGSFSAVVLADVSAESLSDTQQTTLRAYVRDLGRGLLAIGGDTSFGQGEYVGTPLDDVLPVRSSVRSHRDHGRVALMLVIDKSGSMDDDIYHEGTNKLEMARQAASLSAEQLGPRDMVGILAFDSFNHWILPMTSVLGLGPTPIRERLAALSADGGTDIYPAIVAGFDALNQTDARYKHLILLTDGMSCCGGDYSGLLDRMRSANVTLSTIAIGGDADQALLAQLARQGDGRYYFADHARDIPRLMTRETDLATRGPLVEGTIAPRQVSPFSGLASLDAAAGSGIPRLSGYLVTSPKDLAEILLVSDAADPLLARWQYGLGRAVAWTSDLRGRWSDGWLQWPGTAPLFSELVGWTLALERGPLRAGLRADAETGYVTVDEAEPGHGPAKVIAHVAQPGSEPLVLELAATAPGRYEGGFPLAGVGTYLVRVHAQRDGKLVGAAETGLAVSYPAEFRQVSADPVRLALIARAGGGQMIDSPADAFADDLAPVTTLVPLQRTLLWMAAILLPLEIALRRLRISPAEVWDWLRHPRRVEVASPWQSAAEGLQPAAWTPGAWTGRRESLPVVRPFYADTQLSSHVSPGLARGTGTDTLEDGEADALASTLRWLAARRGNSRGDSG